MCRVIRNINRKAEADSLENDIRQLTKLEQELTDTKNTTKLTTGSKTTLIVLIDLISPVRILLQRSLPAFTTEHL